MSYLSQKTCIRTRLTMIASRGYAIREWYIVLKKSEISGFTYEGSISEGIFKNVTFCTFWAKNVSNLGIF